MCVCAFFFFFLHHGILYFCIGSPIHDIDTPLLRECSGVRTGNQHCSLHMSIYYHLTNQAQESDSATQFSSSSFPEFYRMDVEACILCQSALSCITKNTKMYITFVHWLKSPDFEMCA